MSKKKRILIADPNPEVIESLVPHFEELGSEVITCQDGGRCAQLVRDEKFDAIMIEVKLPFMNGMQVASIVRSNKSNRRTPIYIMSEDLNKDVLKRAEGLRLVETLQKPINASELSRTVVNHVDAINRPLTYDTNIINVFLNAAAEVYEFYFGKQPKRGRPGIKMQASPARGAVTGLISFVGDGFVGSIAISVNVPFIKGIAHNVFQDGQIHLDKDLAADLIGETCNQVLGAVKLKFGDMGVRITIGLPKVIVGRNHTINHKVNNPVLFIPIGEDKVGCDLEFCLDQNSVAPKEVTTQPEQHSSGSVLLF